MEYYSLMDKKTTRDRILDAMYQLVSEKGYDKASIGQICTEIGVTKPSVYYYFKSKEDIFLEIIRNLGSIYSCDGIEDVSDVQSYKEYLLSFGSKIIAGYKSDLARRRVMAEISVQSSRIDSLQEYQRTYVAENIAVLKKLLEKGMEVHALPQELDLRIYAELLHTMLIGLSDYVLASESNSDAEKVWALLVGKLCLD